MNAIPFDIFVDILRWLSRTNLCNSIVFVNRYWRDTVSDKSNLSVQPVHLVKHFKMTHKYVQANAALRNFPPKYIRFKQANIRSDACQWPGSQIDFFLFLEKSVHCFEDSDVNFDYYPRIGPAGDIPKQRFASIARLLDICAAARSMTVDVHFYPDEWDYLKDYDHGDCRCPNFVCYPNLELSDELESSLEANKWAQEDAQAIVKWLHYLPKSGRNFAERCSLVSNLPTADHRYKRKMCVSDTYRNGHFARMLLRTLMKSFSSAPEPSKTQFTLWLLSCSYPNQFCIHNPNTEERLSCVIGYEKSDDIFKAEYLARWGTTEEDWMVQLEDINRFTDHDSDEDEEVLKSSRSGSYYENSLICSCTDQFINKVRRKYVAKGI